MGIRCTKSHTFADFFSALWALARLILIPRNNSTDWTLRSWENTAEDPDSGFKPTSGAIHELHFRTMPGVNGNFSLVLEAEESTNSGRSLDIFAHRETREEASTALVQTLSEFSVRGQIHCNVKYLMTCSKKMISGLTSTITAWLDGLISDRDRAPELPDHVVIACGVVLKASAEPKKLEEQVAQCLRNIPPSLDGNWPTLFGS